MCLCRTLHLTETLGFAVEMVAAGYFSLFSLFYAMALGTKGSPEHLGFTGFPDYCPTTHCSVRV